MMALGDNETFNLLKPSKLYQLYATLNLWILLQNNGSSAIVLMETPMVQPQNIDGQFKIAV